MNKPKGTSEEMQDAYDAMAFGGCIFFIIWTILGTALGMGFCYMMGWR